MDHSRVVPGHSLIFSKSVVILEHKSLVRTVVVTGLDHEALVTDVTVVKTQIMITDLHQRPSQTSLLSHSLVRNYSPPGLSLEKLLALTTQIVKHSGAISRV